LIEFCIWTVYSALAICDMALRAVSRMARNLSGRTKPAPRASGLATVTRVKDDLRI